MEDSKEKYRKWVHINKIELATLTNDLLRYRFMFRLLFGYLLFDVYIHFAN